MKRILVISPIPTHPQIAGNRTRIQRLLLSLREMGHEVHFLCVNSEPWKADEKAMAQWWGENFYCVPYRHPPRSLGRYVRRLRFLLEPGFTEVLPVDYRYDPALDIFLTDLAGRIPFDIVIVEYIFWSRALEHFDGSVLKMIDTHDIFTRRHLLYRKAGQSYGWYCTTAKEEAKGLNRADVIIAIQDKEKEYFSKLTGKRVITVRDIAPVHPLPSHKKGGAKLLFIGSDAGTNIHGIRHFIKETLPLIRREHPDVTLEVVGKICDAIDDSEGCVKRGVVDDLASVYKCVDVVVNPIRFSTGLCIKTIEALGYGRPVVTTSAGSRGLEEAEGKSFVVADTPEEFSLAVLRLLKDSRLARSLAESGIAYVRRWNESSLRELADVITIESRSPSRLLS